MNKQTLVSQGAMDIPISELKEALAKAIEADIQQFFTDSLTPDRGYDCPPTSNTMDALRPILAAAERVGRLEKALTDLLERYTSLVNCGNCRNWNPEDEPQVIQARAALNQSGK